MLYNQALRMLYHSLINSRVQYGIIAWRRAASCHLQQCSSIILSSWNPWYTSAFVMEPSLTKIKKTRITCKKITFSLLDTSSNKQLLHKLKSKKFNDSVVLVFRKCICYIQNLANRTGISNMRRPRSRIHLGPQYPRGPPTNCGTHRVNGRYKII